MRFDAADRILIGVASITSASPMRKREWRPSIVTSYFADFGP
jgi:hypothetical protein